MALSPEQRARLLELARASRIQDPLKIQESSISQAASEVVTEVIETPADPIKESFNQITDKYGNLITLNAKQLSFVNLASKGNSCVLIGAAGTGKTTCQKAVVSALIQSGIVGILSNDGHKHLVSGSPGIVICAYTRRAVANIRRNMPEDLQANCITIHKLLEYQPVFYEVDNPETGETQNKMKFEPTRNANNPLPSSIRTIVFEESSMIGTDLHQQVIDACPHQPQIIYLGDIQQLPPVFGPAILGFKLLELPVIELTEVYRQALESPIISLAHRILSARPIPVKEFPEWKHPNQLTIHPWKKKLDPLMATITLAAFFKAAEANGVYNTEEDMILIPFNKACGTDELNLHIADYLAKKNGSVVYQVVAGFMKKHFRIGEKVLYDKEDAVIIDITPNPSYTGAPPFAASTTLNYWGHDPEFKEHNTDLSEDNADFLLSQVAAADKEDRVKKSSHVIKLRMLDSDAEITLESAGEVNSILMGYALTVHKAQGSEFRKVFLCLHQSHATMIQRELLYTAVTRAREELYIICEPESFENGIKSQRVKGDTIEEKASYFKGRLERMDAEKLP